MKNPFLLIKIDPCLLKISDSLGIQWYGIFVALGVFLFVFFSKRHLVSGKVMSEGLYERLIMGSIVAGLCGARLVHVISELQDYVNVWQVVAVWQGGLSILGAVFGVLAFSTFFLKVNQISALPVFDVAAVYLPLTQAVARLGCFCAGCCYGAETAVWWSVMYTHQCSAAPLFVAIHPTQIYSSLWYVMTFVVLYGLFFGKSRPGITFAVYLLLSGIERFCIDFFRADRILNSVDAAWYWQIFSFHQWLSLVIIGLGLLIAAYVAYAAKR